MDRTTFIEKILNRLGNGIINVELTEDHINEAIDDALDIFTRRHYDGTEIYAYKLNLDESSMVFTLPDYIETVVHYYRFNQFNTPTLQRLVLTELNIMYESSNLINFQVFKDYIKTIERLLMPQYDFKFNGVTKQISFTHRPHGSRNTGDEDVFYLKVYKNVSYDHLTSVFDNNWFKRYTTELCRKRWAEIVGKYTKRLPNGATVNFEWMYDDAVNNLERLNYELRTELSEPPGFFVDS